MVKISKADKDDLKQIYEFISRDSVIYAHKVVQSIFKSIKNLENFPESGRIVPELNDMLSVILKMQSKVKYNAVLLIFK